MRWPSAPTAGLPHTGSPVTGTARLWDAATGRPLGPPLSSSESGFRGRGRQPRRSRRPDRQQRRSGPALGSRHRPAPGAAPAPSTCPHRGGFRPRWLDLLTGEIATGVIYQWGLHRPITGVPDRIAAWSRVLTGLDLDEQGGMRVLDRDGFEEFRRRLDKHGGSPEPLARSPIPADRHQIEAMHCESQGRWYAARWHLDRLIADSPRDSRLCRRRS